MPILARPYPQLSERHENLFWSKVSIPSDVLSGCWKWTGARGRAPNLYGEFRLGERSLKAHRLVHETLVGHLQCEEVVRHSCDNTWCVNPNHLSRGSQADNVNDTITRRRHYQLTQTHCKRGHELTPENTQPNKAGGVTKRLCRTCHTARRLEYNPPAVPSLFCAQGHLKLLDAWDTGRCGECNRAWQRARRTKKEEDHVS